ncbi:MAG: sugar ABC transporter permease YjfF, partial [Leptolyngbya sp. PLA1]|nr:sugar ABC transporter permease YjfF [Leptolyngbya sp. PLA1]
MNWRPHLPSLVGPVVVLSMLVLAEVRYPGFHSAGVVSGLWTSRAPLFLVAVGMTWVVMAGGIDLAVGAVATLAGFVAVLAAQYGAPPVLAVLGGALIGVLAGAAQGLAVQCLKLPAFIVTLAGMFLARGASMMLSSEPASLPARYLGELPTLAWGGAGAELTVTSLGLLVVAVIAIVWDFRSVG